MNERIKQLARLAQGKNPDDYAPDDDIVILATGDVEKFAELIVRECMQLGDKALQDGKWPGDVLKEHFGVKE
jgi:hypothetical protein